MEFAVSTATLIASLVLLASGRRRLEFGSFPATTLTFLELLGLGLAVVSLGWWGLGVLGLVNIIAALVWSVVLAAKVESKLVYAAIQAGVSKDDIKQLADRLGRVEELKVVGPIDRAELIRLLADRNRKPDEIEQMAVPIGMLKTIHSVPWPWLVEGFDRLLRLTNESASKSGELADTLHASSQNAAASFREIVDSLVLFYGGDAALSSQAAA